MSESSSSSSKNDENSSTQESSSTTKLNVEDEIQEGKDEMLDEIAKEDDVVVADETVAEKKKKVEESSSEVSTKDEDNEVEITPAEKRDAELGVTGEEEETEEEKGCGNQTEGYVTSDGPFLNLRPPSDSPARMNTIVTFDIPPAVERFSLPPQGSTSSENSTESFARTTMKDFGSLAGFNTAWGGGSTTEEQDSRKRPRAQTDSPPHSDKTKVKRDHSLERKRKIKTSLDGKGKKKRAHQTVDRIVAVIRDDFDPITYTHLHLAADIIHSEIADEVWLMPTVLVLNDEKQTNIRDRLIMCHLAVNSFFGSDFPVKVSSYAMDYPKKETRDMISEGLKTQHPFTHFRFVVTTENFKDVQRTTFGTSDLDLETPILLIPTKDSREVLDSEVEEFSDCIVFESNDGVTSGNIPSLASASKAVKLRMKLDEEPLPSADPTTPKNSSIADDSTPKKTIIDFDRSFRDKNKQFKSKIARCHGFVPPSVLKYLERYGEETSWQYF